VRLTLPRLRQFNHRFVKQRALDEFAQHQPNNGSSAARPSASGIELGYPEVAQIALTQKITCDRHDFATPDIAASDRIGAELVMNLRTPNWIGGNGIAIGGVGIVTVAGSIGTARDVSGPDRDLLPDTRHLGLRRAIRQGPRSNT